jgi:hypothetical protein
MPSDHLAQVQEVPQENETPTVSPTDNNTEGTQPSQGGDTNTPDVENIPFHKHPRWIERQRQFEKMEQELQELRPLKDEFEQIRAKVAPTEQEMPDWWKEAFGTDEASQQAFKKQVEYQQKVEADLEQRLLTKVQERQAEQQRSQQEEVQKWESYIESEVQTLRDKGYTFNRNELLKVVEDFSKDGEGNFTGHLFPFEKAYEILQLKKTVPDPTATARKTAAGLSSTGTKTGSSGPSVPTLTEIRQRGWSGWRND